MQKSSGNTSNLVRTKGVSDYSSWNKYDADTELLKMDLEEEKKREKMKKEEQEKRKNAETDRLDLIVKEAGDYIFSIFKSVCLERANRILIGRARSFILVSVPFLQNRPIYLCITHPVE